MIDCASLRDSEPGLTLSPTVMYPVDLSLLSAAAPCDVSGLMTEETSGCLARSVAAVLTALAYLESVSLPPLGACSTIGLVPFACVGNGFCKVSVALWLLVPGSDRLSLVFSPICCDIPTRATATTNQTPTTMNRRRTQKCAIRYRTPVMLSTPIRVAWTDLTRCSQGGVRSALGRSLDMSLARHPVTRGAVERPPVSSRQQG